VTHKSARLTPSPYIIVCVGPSVPIGTEIAPATMRIGIDASLTRARETPGRLAHRRAQARETPGRLAHRGVHVLLGIGLLETLLDDADAQARHALAQRVPIRLDLYVLLPRVVAVRPGQHLEQRCVVGHVGGHPAGVIATKISIGMMPV
jgi:hypothetical protein